MSTVRTSKWQAKVVGWKVWCDEKETPTLSDIRRWVISSRKKAFGINIYEMGGSSFLFEFPNKHVAEHVLHGDWTWKQLKLHLQWWTPTGGCCTQRKSSTWIRAVGLPLHLWTENAFKAIGDGVNIPRDVKLSEKGLTFFILISPETQALVITGKRKKSMGKNLWVLEDNRGRNRDLFAGRDNNRHVSSVFKTTAGMHPGHVHKRVK
ncbi:hypothetical protein KY285_030095 [Solanum tuberosum]|nr:hypothetical protein KY289_030235 [Solanum tuberosum]KAH0655213.1 hypothetical protein KY285_030095 [Solanum tuberosum]